MDYLYFFIAQYEYAIKNNYIFCIIYILKYFIQMARWLVSVTFIFIYVIV